MDKFDQARVYFFKGLNSLKNEDFSEAELFFLRALQFAPNRISILNNLAVSRIKLRNFDEARKNLDTIYTIEKNSVEFWLNMGILSLEMNHVSEAIIQFDKCLSLDPNNILAWKLKAQIYDLNKQYELSEFCLKKIISLDASDSNVLILLSAVLNDLHKYDEAIQYIQKVISIEKNHVNANVNMAVALNGLKKFEFALLHYSTALKHSPSDAHIWSNKAVTLTELHRYDEALAHFEKALSLNPKYAEGWSNKAVTLTALHRYDEALAHFEKALSLNPDISWAYGEMIHLKMNMCIWESLDEALKNIKTSLLANKKVIPPFALLSLIDDPELQKISSEICSQKMYKKNNKLGFIEKRSIKDKIRIGYYSADFHDHATSYLMAELFELHDKSLFEIFCFSFGPNTNSEIQQRLKKSFSQFIQVENKTNLEICELSRELKIDIAIDLKGYTQNSRTEIFSYRAAPIQISYLGYPGTMGSDYIDFIIGDRILIPNEYKEFYSEKIVCLPHCYQCNDRKRIISKTKYSRYDFGLPENAFVFCCFNNNYKIVPKTFEGWLRILKQVEGSVLWLLKDNSWVVENLKNEAEKNGVNPNRIIFAERIPLAEHLARHSLANLFLDTYPYNAHTTASDALWAGLPLITLIGKSFASRVSASLLSAIGLPQLITHSQDDYEALAIGLALDSSKLILIKNQLSENRLSTPLFDAPAFAKALEALYVKIYKNYHQGLVLGDIYL
jgi:protein O-GlcNAc transferase